jgi:hypothetical protein
MAETPSQQLEDDDDDLTDVEELEPDDDEEPDDELAELTVAEHLARADELLGRSPQVTEREEDSDDAER